eukprot:TRINITY_DN1122_c0_g2_i1.p1 TRINITY_DN1122_c0_g2~~TRINITY_DN1122_c0_g2_i1.p1  ORF type:complete len:442 (+),score=60.83 TRINITY_DN1122_c0_g2_i1:74-1399(+)
MFSFFSRSTAPGEGEAAAGGAADAEAAPVQAWRPPWPFGISPPSTFLRRMMEFENSRLHKMKHTYRQNLLDIDVFPYDVQPLIGGQFGMRSYFGVLGTCVVIILMAWRIVSTHQTFALRDRPVVSSISTPVTDNDIFRVELGAEIQVSSTTFYNTSFAKLKFQYNNLTRDAFGNTYKQKSDFQLTTCNFLDLSVVFRNSFCPGFNNDDGTQTRVPVPLQGTFSSPQFQFLSVEAHKCTPGSKEFSDVTCAATSAVESTWTGMTLNILLPARKTVDPPQLNTFFFSYPGLGWVVKSDVFITRHYLTDYSNVYVGFWEAPQYDDFYMIDRLDTRMLQVESDAPTRIWKANIRISDSYTSETRVYPTYLNLVAMWGGFFAFVSTIIGLVFQTYNMKRFMRHFTWEIDMNHDPRYPHQAVVCRPVPVDDTGMPLNKHMKKPKKPM